MSRRLLAVVCIAVLAWAAGCGESSKGPGSDKDMAGAILIGNGLGGIIQGTLGGVIFALFGFNSPFLWGVIMALMAFLPIVGIGIVFIPASIYLFLYGRFAAGIFFIVFYVLTYVFAVMPYFVVKNMGDYKRTFWAYLFVIVVSSIIHLLYPMESIRPKIQLEGFFASLMLFAGCGGGGGGTKTPTSGFRGGDKALTMEFGQDSPPESVRDLILFLASEKSGNLTGKMISAIRDNWKDSNGVIFYGTTCFSSYERQNGIAYSGGG